MPSHLLAAEVGGDGAVRSAFGGPPPPDPVAANVLAPEDYATLLYELGFDRQHVRLQVYPHVLPRLRRVVEWVRGTTLTRFFKRLPAELHEPFVDDVPQRAARPARRARPVLLPFRRILMWGRH